MLNNRELASLLLLVSFIAFAIYKGAKLDVRGLARAACHPKLLALWLSYAGVIALCVLGLGAAGFSYKGYQKDAVVWAVIVGLPILGQFPAVGRDPSRLWSMWKKALGLTAIVAFYVNLYVFPLLVEVVVQAMLATLAMLGVVVKSDQKYRPAQKLVAALTGASGLILLLVVGMHLAGNGDKFNSAQVALSFLNPLYLTLAVLALAYVVGRISHWELERIRRRFNGGAST